MLKLNPNGYTFNRGGHKLAVQFFGPHASDYAKQFQAIMTGRDTYKIFRQDQMPLHSHCSINRGFLGSRPIHTVTVTQEGKKVAVFHSQSMTEVAIESHAFINGALDVSVTTPASTEPPAHTPDRVRAGLQRKVEEQRKEIAKLKTGGPQGNEIARLQDELRAVRKTYADLQQTLYGTLRRAERAETDLRRHRALNNPPPAPPAPPAPDLEALEQENSLLRSQFANRQKEIARLRAELLRYIKPEPTICACCGKPAIGKCDGSPL